MSSNMTSQYDILALFLLWKWSRHLSKAVCKVWWQNVQRVQTCPRWPILRSFGPSVESNDIPKLKYLLYFLDLSSRQTSIGQNCLHNMKSLCGCIMRSLQCVHNLGVQIAAWNIIFVCLKELYSPRNDPDPEMIPTFLLVDPEMTPKELGNGN